MYGIIKRNKQYFVVPMECITTTDKIIAMGIANKLHGHKIVQNIVNKNIQRKLDKQ